MKKTTLLSVLIVLVAFGTIFYIDSSEQNIAHSAEIEKLAEEYANEGEFAEQVQQVQGNELTFSYVSSEKDGECTNVGVRIKYERTLGKFKDFNRVETFKVCK